MRRGIIFVLCAAAIVAGKVQGQAVSGLKAVRVASGFDRPLFVTAPPGDTAHLYIGTQIGQIYVVDLSAGTTSLFLDISSRLTSTDGEQGLLGMAFDPEYATNGNFYLNYTIPGGQWGNGTTRVSQFYFQTAKKKKKKKRKPPVVTLIENVLLTFDHPQANHNGGWIGFSPRIGDDHNLYVATGDGGAGNDQGTGHIEPGGNAQNLTTLLGKMLRIHVTPNSATYSIPSNNPYASCLSCRQEIFAFGLRNPFRNSFDRQTGVMFLGEVGQDTREEIDVQQATNPGGGENYGWRLREGTIATPTGGVGGAPPAGNVDPIFDYPHSTGQTVIGGYVYRGNIRQLQGVYVFGDYLGPETPGSTARIFTLNYDGTSASNFQDITSELFPTADGFNLNYLSSLGEDANGELYICDIYSGNIFKIVSPIVAVQNVTALENRHALVSGTGTPLSTLTILATGADGSSFSPVGTVTVSTDGKFVFEDSFAANFPGRQYRATAQ